MVGKSVLQSCVQMSQYSLYNFPNMLYDYLQRSQFINNLVEPVPVFQLSADIIIQIEFAGILFIFAATT